MSDSAKLLDDLGPLMGWTVRPGPPSADVKALGDFLAEVIDRIPRGEQIKITVPIEWRLWAIETVHLLPGCVLLEYLGRQDPHSTDPRYFAEKIGPSSAARVLQDIQHALREHVQKRRPR